MNKAIPLFNCSSINASDSQADTRLAKMENAPGLIRETEYEKYVRINRLNELAGQVVPSWSGRGIHVYFPKKVQANAFLPYQWYLGVGAFGSVQAVSCRSKSGPPVLIVRKYIYGRTGPKLRAFMEEAKTCAQFKHKHLVQFIGTYAAGDDLNLALLQFPVGKCTLTEFMKGMYEEHCVYREFRSYLQAFLPCLANAIAYIHTKGPIKHMDIKPENIIIKENAQQPFFSVFVSDFGLARRIHSHGISQSNGSTGFTREYAAPEIVPDDNPSDSTLLHPDYRRQQHTRRTDIFSLGCVFTEMATVATSTHTLEQFKDYRKDNYRRASSAYSRNLPRVEAWLNSLEKNWKLPEEKLEFWQEKLALIRRMLKEDPQERPSSEQLFRELDAEQCCSEEFEDCTVHWDT